MKRWPGFLLAMTAVAMLGCMGEVDGTGGPGDPNADDSVVTVNMSVKAYDLANQVILETRPTATKLLVDKLNLELVNKGILEKVMDVEGKMFSPLTNGTPPTTCPYLQKAGKGAAQNCRYIVDRAIEHALVAASGLKTTVERDIYDKHGSSLKQGEAAYVYSWAAEAILSGIDVGGVQAVRVLRSQRVCDQNPNVSESAFQLGEKQGKALLEQTEKAVLPTIPKTQCNTDIIASTIYAETKKKYTAFTQSNRLCKGYKPGDLKDAVDLTKEENNRLKGLRQGGESAYESLRVRLVKTWKCVPPPDPCLCYARYGGKGPVYCFPKSTYSRIPPRNGVELYGYVKNGRAQCTGKHGTAKPVGSPLVLDLDGDGISLDNARKLSFDVAATGEAARIPTVAGADRVLVLDLDGNGQVDSGLELFGNATLCGNQRCTDGLEALARHDANRDGVIDHKDPVFSRLRLWDMAGELAPLAAAKIKAIRLDSRLDLAWTDTFGNSATRAMDFVRDNGSEGVMHDVWFNLSFDKLPKKAASSGITSRLNRR